MSIFGFCVSQRNCCALNMWFAIPKLNKKKKQKLFTHQVDDVFFFWFSLFSSSSSFFCCLILLLLPTNTFRCTNFYDAVCCVFSFIFETIPLPNGNDKTYQIKSSVIYYPNKLTWKCNKLNTNDIVSSNMREYILLFLAKLFKLNWIE